MVDNFFGWESERVVALTSERNIMAQITCAKTLLSVIILGGDRKTKKYFQHATDLGLIEKVQLSRVSKSCITFNS